MKEDLIQLPDVTEIKELLDMAKQDIKSEIEEDPEAAQASKLLLKVIDVINEKIAKNKDLTKLAEKDEIDFAAHLNFLHCLLEDFFISDDDFDDEDDEDLDLNDFEEDEE